MVSILFLAANPKDTPHLELIGECNSIDKEIRLTKYGNQFKLEQRHSVSLSELQDHLMRFEPNIVHFSGHGSSEGTLIFQNAEGYWEDTSPEALAKLFKIINKNNRIRCVVLNACYSEDQADAIAKNVDCVIGMSASISDIGARKFAESFYHALGYGKSVKEAFDLAQNQLELIRIPEEYIPKLKHNKGFDPSTLNFVAIDKIANEIPAKETDITDSIKNVLNTSNSKPTVFRGESRIFVGRDDSRNIIRKLLSESNDPISIIGEGGIGKTSLAFKSIHENDKEFDVIIPVYLEFGLSFNSFRSAIGRGLGMTEEKIQSIDDQALLDSLGSCNHPLVFLDNYETLLSGVRSKKSEDAIKITRFIENLPQNAVIILTSREIPNIDGERPLRLDGLSEAEGKELFMKLARHRFLSGEPPRQMQDKLKELCKKTGGHPLAIELLTRTYKGGGVQEISGMISHLDIGVTNPKAKEQRMRSLKNCFDYSYMMLNSKKRKILPKLTIFNSPFPRKAVESIFGVQYVGYLDDYCDQSMMRKIESDEFDKLDADCMLYYFHPMIFQYLRSKLSTDNETEKEHRPKYFRYYIQHLEEVYDALQTDRSRLRCVRILLESENNDIEKAVNSITDMVSLRRLLPKLGAVMRETGKLEKSLNCFEKVLTLPDNSDYLVADVSSDIGMTYFMMGHYQKSLDYHNRALDLDIKLGRRSQIAHDYSNIGIALRFMGRYQEALERHKLARELNKQLGDQAKMASDNGNIAINYEYLGNYQQALDLLKETLNIHESSGYAGEIAVGYANIGNVLLRLGRFDESLQYHKKSLAKYEKLGDPKGIGIELNNTGVVLSKLEMFDAALELFERSIVINHQTQNIPEVGRSFLNRGAVLFRLDRIDEAKRSFEAALSIYGKLRDELQIASCYANIGLLMNDRQYLEKAIDIHNALNDKIGLGRDYQYIGRICEHLNNTNEALSWYEKALSIHKEFDDRPEIGEDYEHVSIIHLELGNLEQAIDFGNKTTSLYEESGQHFLAAKSLYNTSLALIKSQRISEANALLSRAKYHLSEFQKTHNYHHEIEDAINNLICELEKQ